MNITIGLKEIAILAVIIPFVYDRMKAIDDKYNEKEYARRERYYSGVRFKDIFIDSDGNTWRIEK